MLRALLCAAWALGLTQCQSRKSEPPAPPPLKVQAQSTSGPSEPLDPGIGDGPPQVAGTMDAGNRYLSTVMLTNEPKSRVARCSGVLIHPRLVLTAASCLCGSPKGACEQRAYVGTVRYGLTGDRQFQELSTEMRFASYEGRVQPHPGFAATSAASVQGRADLALVVLDSPVPEDFAPVVLADTEVQAKEELVMAGYSEHTSWGGRPGIRYFRRNLVTQLLDTPAGQGVYEQQGAFLYNGFTGGPCLREQGNERQLVGVASLGTEGQLTFTRIHPFRAWLADEMQRATSTASKAELPPLKE